MSLSRGHKIGVTSQKVLRSRIATDTETEWSCEPIRGIIPCQKKKKKTLIKCEALPSGKGISMLVRKSWNMQMTPDDPDRWIVKTTTVLLIHLFPPFHGLQPVWPFWPLTPLRYFPSHNIFSLFGAVSRQLSCVDVAANRLLPVKTRVWHLFAGHATFRRSCWQDEAGVCGAFCRGRGFPSHNRPSHREFALAKQVLSGLKKKKN